MQASTLFNRIKAGATAHASDTPDHEVGDLQDALVKALDLLTGSQIAALARDPEILGIICGNGPEDPTEVFEHPEELSLDRRTTARLVAMGDSLFSENGAMDPAKLLIGIFGVDELANGNPAAS